LDSTESCRAGRDAGSLSGVLTDATPDPDGRDSAADMEAVEAIYESAETGQRVEVGDADV
jgi:predicted dehydrogenase